MIQTITIDPIEPDAAEPAIANYHFDRRRASRFPLSGRATILRQDHDIEAYLMPLATLDLDNMSETGLAGVSSLPLAIDEKVTVYFAPHGAEEGVELHGHVVRCKPSSDRQVHRSSARDFEIAVHFDPRVAA